MKITLEFENAEKFVTELPRFAELMGFAGQFASFTHVSKPSTEPVLDAPDLPNVEKTNDARKVTGTPEQLEKISSAIKKEKTKEAPTSEAKPAQKAPEKKQPDKSEDKEEKHVSGSANAATPALKETDVRKKCNALIQTGHRDDLKALLRGFEAENFSALAKKPECFPEFIRLIDVVLAYNMHGRHDDLKKILEQDFDTQSFAELRADDRDNFIAVAMDSFKKEKS